MAWSDDVGGQHGLNLSFYFVFLEIWVAVWADIDWFLVGECGDAVV